MISISNILLSIKKKRWNLICLIFLGFFLFTPSCEKPERYVKLEALEIPETDIYYTYAVLKGEIIDIGSVPISDHGIVYTESGIPALGVSQELHLGPLSSKGVFQDTIKNLKKNTLYYFRVFVIVNGEEKYSQKTPKFKTKDTKEPTVTAGAVTDITMSSALLTGEVASDGGEPETVKGLCWGASPNPTITSCLDTTLNGSGKGSFTGAISGLNPGTSYYIRAYATNSKGTAYNSADVVFKTHNLPKVNTTEVTTITNTGAASGGNVTDDGDTEVTARGICWGTMPSPTIELTSKTTDGSGKGTFISTITGLTPLTTYFVRSYATNKYGTSYGEEISITATKPPSVITKAATLIGNTTATLNANVNAHSFSTTVTFEYGTTTEYGSSITSSTSPVSGTTTTDVLANLTLLSPGITYHFRVKAESAGGTVYGEDLTCTTLQPPLATTSAATNVTTTSATLNGTANANNSSTSVTFQYGPTTEYGSSIASTPSPVEGNTSTNVTASLTGLNEGTVYHYRIRAISDGGTAYGEDVIISSLASPVATTTPATSVTGLTATLNATVNAKGLSTTVEFEYGISTSYGTTIAATQSPVTGSSDTPVSIGLTGLAAGTTYHFRVKTVSSAGTTFGENLPFTTLQPPTAASLAATLARNTTVTLNGTVNANYSSATVTFEYGTTTAYGTTITAIQSPVTGYEVTSVSADLTGLTPGTAYHFIMKAVSPGGTTLGSDMTFTTTQPPTVSTGNAESVSTTTVALNGTVNANSLSSIVTFEYGLTTDYGFTATAIQSPVTGNSATSVSANLIGLTPSTTYYFRVTAVSSAGTTSGNNGSFTTTEVPPTVTDYNGNIYSVVKIGTQDWMQQNMKVKNFSNGDPISLVEGVIWTEATYPAYCNVNGDVSNYATYGLLFNFYVAKDPRNVCPTGWHVPTQSDWITLETTLGGPSVAGGKLKEEGLDHWLTPNTNATNSSGFTGLPGGYRYYTWWNLVWGPFMYLGDWGCYWENTIPYARVLYASNEGLGRIYTDFKSGLSIRCLKGALPLSETVAATAIASSSSTLNGIVNPNGATTTVSFEYGTTTSYGTTITSTQGSVSESLPINVSADLIGLTPGTTYHYRVKAVNTGGTSLGPDMTFTTPTQVTDYESNVYNSVIIGAQIWMQENLKSTKYSDGTPISGIWAYGNDLGNVPVYGYLYNWYAVMNGASGSDLNPSGVQGICPTGWHVPSANEWDELSVFLVTDQGGKLKEAGFSHWTDPNSGATNESGFSALPGGSLMNSPYYGFMSFGSWAGFWTSTFVNEMVESTSKALYYNNAGLGGGNGARANGLSLRCIKD